MILECNYEFMIYDGDNMPKSTKSNGLLLKINFQFKIKCQWEIHERQGIAQHPQRNLHMHATDSWLGLYCENC